MLITVSPPLTSPPLSPSSEGAAMASGSSEVTATQEPAEAAEECSGKETPPQKNSLSLCVLVTFRNVVFASFF